MIRRWLGWLALQLYRGLLFIYFGLVLLIALILAMREEVDVKLFRWLIVLAVIMLAGEVFARWQDRS